MTALPWAVPDPDVHAGIVPISNPGDPVPGGGTYLSTTTKIGFPPEFSLVNSVSDSKLTATFSSQLQVLDVSTGSWGTWNSPPATEDANPLVLWTQGKATLTITFSTPVTTFGVEMQPNQQTVDTETATFFNGAASQGVITRQVDGNGGALLFAAVTNGLPFTSVLLSDNGGDFGFAELRYKLLAAPVPVPEPDTLMMIASSVPILLAYLYRSHRSRPNHK
jgi:hypothetical protein